MECFSLSAPPCLTTEQCYVAHAGDSRCVLCRAGRAVQLTRDHKPGLPSEYARIVVSTIIADLFCRTLATATVE